MNLAIDAGGVSLAFVLLYTAPAFVAVLAWPLLGERLTRRKATLVALAVAGVALVAQAGGGGVRATPAALGWGLAAGASYAAYYLFGKWVLHRYAPVTIFAVVLPLGALGLLPFVDFVPKDPVVWAWLVALGLVSTYLAYLVYYTGLRTTEASRAVLVATDRAGRRGRDRGHGLRRAARLDRVGGRRAHPDGGRARGGPGTAPGRAVRRLTTPRAGATLPGYATCVQFLARRPRRTHAHRDPDPPPRPTPLTHP